MLPAPETCLAHITKDWLYFVAVELSRCIDDACNSSTRSSMFQIINVVVPTFQSMLGSLWPYSTAKLEARGGRVKPIVRRCVLLSFLQLQISEISLPLRRQTCARPKAPGYSSSQQLQTLTRVKMREVLISQTGRSPKAGQLQSLGRLKSVNKQGNIEEEVPSQWAAHITPMDFNCIHVYELLLRKTISPMYDMNGRLQARMGDQPEAATGRDISPDISDSSCDSASDTANDSD